MAEGDDDCKIVDILKPFKLRQGRRHHRIWRQFKRYERKVYSGGDNVQSTRTIAKCIKCDHTSSTNLDTLANHVLFGGDTWTEAVKEAAQEILDNKMGRMGRNED